MSANKDFTAKKNYDPVPSYYQPYRGYYSPYASTLASSRYYTPGTASAYYPYSQYGRSYGYTPTSSLAPAPVKQGQTYSEYIPVQKSYVEQVPETYVRYTPVEHQYTDYVEVRHEIDYVPVPRVEYDYVPQERSYVAGEVPGGLTGSRVLGTPYDYVAPGSTVVPSTYAPLSSSLYRPRTSSLGYGAPSAYKATGNYASYYSPYKQ